VTRNEKRRRTAVLRARGKCHEAARIWRERPPVDGRRKVIDRIHLVEMLYATLPPKEESGVSYNPLPTVGYPAEWHEKEIAEEAERTGDPWLPIHEESEEDFDEDPYCVGVCFSPEGLPVATETELAETEGFTHTFFPWGEHGKRGSRQLPTVVYDGLRQGKGPFGAAAMENLFYN